MAKCQLDDPCMFEFRQWPNDNSRMFKYDELFEYEMKFHSI